MKREAYNNYYPKKKRSGSGWLLFLIIIVAAIIYANSKGVINLGSFNFGNISIGSTTSSCMQKVNNCASIINSKFGTTVTVLNQTQAQNSVNANSFLESWKSSSQSGDISQYNISSYPITLVATRFNSSSGLLSPYVFICKSDGNLEEKSISELC